MFWIFIDESCYFKVLFSFFRMSFFSYNSENSSVNTSVFCNFYFKFSFSSLFSDKADMSWLLVVSASSSISLIFSVFCRSFSSSFSSSFIFSCLCVTCYVCSSMRFSALAVSYWKALYFSLNSDSCPLSCYWNLGTWFEASSSSCLLVNSFS